MQRRLLPSLNAMVAFEATARFGSIAQAAVELNLSQSAISRLVRQVEGALNVQLFQRVRQRVVLTETGRAYAQTVHRLITEFEQDTFRVMAYGKASGSLSLGVFSTFGAKWLIPRLSQFQLSRPGVIISCFIRPAPFDFDSDPLDAAIHYGEPVWPGSISVPLFGETLVPVASPDLAGIRTVSTPADLIRFPLLHEITRPSAWWDWFLGVGIEEREALQGARFDQFSLVSAAAQARLGVGLIPSFLVEEELASGRLIIPVEYRTTGPHKYHLVYPHRNSGMQLLEEFKDWLVKSGETNIRPLPQVRPPSGSSP